MGCGMRIGDHAQTGKCRTSLSDSSGSTCNNCQKSTNWRALEVFPKSMKLNGSCFRKGALVHDFCILKRPIPLLSFSAFC